MDIPVINPSTATVGAIFPPLPPTALTREITAEIYSLIIKQFDSYTSCNLLPQGGAHIQRQDGSYVRFEPDRIQVNDYIQDVAFQHAKERIVALFRSVLSKISPQVCLVTGIKLVAHIDTSKPEGGRHFTFGLMDRQLTAERVESVLGPKLQGVGFRFNLLKEQPTKAEYDLRVEPFFRQPSKLFVDLDVQFPGPEKSILDRLESRIGEVSTFLKGDVKEFLSTYGGGVQ